MIISRISGGLGNQMFQFAIGRSLSIRHATQLLLDLSWFKNMGCDTPRQFHLNAFPAIAKKNKIWRECTSIEKWRICGTAKILHFFSQIFNITTQRINIFQEMQPVYREDLPLTRPTLYLNGYWQDERYFFAVKDQIRNDFSFPSLTQNTQVVAEQIKADTDSVSVHVRRGDYVSNPLINSIHGLCPIEYYIEAIKTIKIHTKSPVFFIFSDDYMWAQEHFTHQNFQAEFPVLNIKHSEFNDMHLMSLCKHHIIANSSFSWWGAWLSSNNGIIIAPRQWFRDNDYNPCPNQWLRIGPKKAH